MLAESHSNRNSFAEKLKLLMERAGYPERGRPTVISQYVPVSKTAVQFWLKGQTMPTEETLQEFHPLIEHLVERIEDQTLKSKDVFAWLTRPNASNPFVDQASQIKKTNQIYNPQLVVKVGGIILGVAEQLKISIDKIPSETFQLILDSACEDAYKNKSVNKTYVKSLLQVAVKIK